MTTYTDTIGVGGHFATLQLWHNTSGSVPVSGDVMDVEFLSGTHNIGGTYSYFSATDLTINLKAHASALHNGEWDGPVQITWSGALSNWIFDDQTINLNLNDLVIKMTADTFFRWEHIGTSGSSAGYDSNLTFNRCLISNWSQDYYYISVAYLSLFDGPSSSPTAYGTFKWEMNNCVVEQQNAARNLLFNSDYSVANPYYAQKRYLNGCTFKNVSFGDRSTDNGPLDIQVSGCLNDSGSTRLIPFTASNYTATVTDYITSEADTGAQFGLWATGTNTNVSTAASFNYDGTVTSGQVNFVDNGSLDPSSFRDFRLVSDIDNLAVKYCKNSPINTQDVTFSTRPPLTDAGAFQSVSTRVVDATIGVSGYATYNLWQSGDNPNGYWGTQWLHGDTYNFTYDPGVYSSTADVINVNTFDKNSTVYYRYDPVGVTYNIKGRDSHNGNWDQGTIFSGSHSSRYVRFLNCQAGVNAYAPLSISFEDLVIIQSDAQYGTIDRCEGVNGAMDFHTTFKRCLLEGARVSNSRPFILLHTGFGTNYETDSLGNVTKLGTVTLNLIDTVFNTRSYFAQVNNGSYTGNRIFNLKGCTSNGGGFGADRLTTLSNPSLGTVGLNVEGCVFDNLQGVDGFYTRPNIFPNITSYSEGWSAVCVDSIFTTPEANNASLTGVAVNSVFGASAFYDGTVTPGQVNFVDNGDVTPSAFRDYRLVADADNLPVQYFTSNRGTFSDGNAAVTYRDITNNLRPGDSDAGAYQSIDTSVSSFEIGASSLGHVKDGDYATVVLWHNDNKSKFLNETTHELTLLDGEHDMPFSWLDQDNRVNHKVKVKGETSHQGYWTSGTSFNFGGLGYVNNNGGAINQSVSWSFEDLVINHSSWLLRALVPYFETVDKDYVFGLNLNNCLVSSTVTGNISLAKVDTRRKSELTLTNNVFNLVAGFFDSLTRGSVIVRGNTFRSPGHFQDFISTTGDSSGVIEGNLYEGPTSRRFVNGFDSGLTLRDNILNIPSNKLPTFSNVTGTLALVNNTVGASFNYDGTVTSGEVCYVGSGDTGDIDYRLVADVDNLAVRYMDLSSIYVTCSKDITGFRRPGSTDAGAYQSISDRVISGTIGTGGDYDTFSLFWNSQSSDEFLNGDTYQAIFKDGEYGRYALTNYGFDNKQVNLNIEIIGETPHNGNWGVGARFKEGIQSDTAGVASRQDINFLLKDVICRQTEGFDFTTNVFHNFFQRSGDYTGPYSRNPLTDQFTENVYHSKIMHENCLISLGSSGSPITGQYGRNFASLGQDCAIDDRPGEHPRPYNNVSNGITLNYTPNIVERGSLTLGFDNCLILGDKFGQGVSRIDNFGTNSASTYHLKMNGCTVRDVESIGTSEGRIRIHYDLNGCLIETSGVGGQTVAFIDYDWHGSESINQSTFRTKDCIFSQASSTLVTRGGYQIPAGSGILENSIASGFVTNTQFGVPFSYDGTVTNGEVGFQAGGGDLSTLRTYYPVADLDNLAVKYMTQDSHTYKDITGYKRPAGIDQRDAGAYQSISDKVTVRNIGTSSADFTPDYATLNLWDSDYYDNANVLNGETHVMRLKSGEDHSCNILRISMDGQANVNQSFILSGHEPHNGEWEAGPILDDQTGIQPETDANNFSVKFKDIVVSGSTSGDVQTRPLTQRFGDATYEQGNASTEHTFEFENCLIKYISTRFYSSNQSPQLNYGANKGYITDDDGNIIERGVTHFIFKNSFVIHPYPTSASFGGVVLLGGEFSNTNSSATFLAEGCTFINTVFRSNRYGSNLQFSAIGCLIYNDPSAPGLRTGSVGHSFLTGGGSRDPDDYIIKDCIFNRGAGNALYDQSTADDRLTFWLAEPLESEYANHPSSNFNSFYVSANANNYYWPRVNATNMSIRTPFVFGEKAASGEVSFRPDSLSSTEPFQQGDGSLGIDYAVNSELPLYDITGVLRDSDPNAGAYEGFYKFDTLVAFGNVYINLY